MASFSDLNRRIFPILTFVSLTLCCLLVSCGPSDGEDPEPTPEQIVINEIYAAGDDWVELYNSGDESKDISGYKIYDDATNKYTIPGGTTIGAKGFLILNCDGTGTGLNTNFKISSTGETIYLDNKEGTLIDKAEVPELNNGQSYGRYPDGTGAFAVSGNTSKGTSNDNANAPAISDVVRNPMVPGLGQAVTVSATVTGSNIGTVKLYYRFNNGSFSSLNMTAAGSVYSAIIPAQNSEGEVEYYIVATSTSGVESRHPADDSNYHDYLLNTDELPQLVINEFLALNVSCCPDVQAAGDEYDDWIEIYNNGAVAVDIGGMYLSDKKTNPFGSKIPDDAPAQTTIQPGGYLILWADEQRDQGPLHVNFKLSGSGEDVGLYYIDGREIDAYTFGVQSDDKSYGRTTDGAGTWKQFATPTKGASNN